MNFCSVIVGHLCKFCDYLLPLRMIRGKHKLFLEKYRNTFKCRLHKRILAKVVSNLTVKKYSEYLHFFFFFDFKCSTNLSVTCVVFRFFEVPSPAPSLGVRLKFLCSGKVGIISRSVGRGCSRKYEQSRHSSADIRFSGSNINSLLIRETPLDARNGRRCLMLLYGWYLNVKFLAAGSSLNPGHIFSFGEPSRSIIIWICWTSVLPVKKREYKWHHVPIFHDIPHPYWMF